MKQLVRKQRPGEIVLKVRPDVPYRPLAHQLRFHASPAFLKILLCGYGGGKTLAGSAELLRQAFAQPGIALLDVSPTYQMSKRTVLDTLRQLLDATEIPHTWRASDREFRFENGSRIWLGSADKAEHLKGANIGGARLDEFALMNKAVFDQVLARLRQPGFRRFALCTGTPEGVGGWAADLVQGELGRQFDLEVIQAATTANVHLAPEYVRALLSTLDERQARAYVYGEMIDLIGNRAFVFDPQLNVRTCVYNPDARLYVWLDFNVDPAVAVFAQIEGDKITVVDELYLTGGANTERVCQEILARYGRHKAGLAVTGDPAGAARDSLSQVVGWGDFDLIRDRLRGVPHLTVDLPGQIPLVASLNLVNAKLRNALGESHLFIDPRCKWLLRDLQQVKRSPDGGLEKKSDASLTHLADALRYGCWVHAQGPRYAGVTARQLWR